MSGNDFLSAQGGGAPCPPQQWPAGLPPCPTKRIGLTDPLTPHAAHPTRFQQVQQQRTAQAVYNPNDAGGEASLASLAAQEQARRRLFVSSSQSCGDGLKHLLVTLDSSQADALRDDACNSGETKGTTFNVRLETPMTDMLANRFVYGQLRSWEIALQRLCTADPQRALALVRAPTNTEPLFDEENYSLPISEQYAVTPQRQALHLPLSGTRCPQVLLPLTLAHVERVIAFRWHRAYSGARRLADVGDGDLYSADDGALPLYAFRTSEEHGFAPGLRFSLVLPSKVDDDPYEPDNADHFVVVDAGHMAGGAAPWLDCREFVALRCKRVECAAREARIFDPWDLQGAECRKYGCEATAPRIEAPVPDEALAFLRQGSGAACGLCGGEQREDSDVFWARDFDDSEIGAFVYVSPATSPQQLAHLANGALRSQFYCGCDFFDDLGVQVRYEPTVDQFVAVDGRGTRTQMRSLFGDDCGAATTLNFPLRRSAMVVSECALDYKQLYLERTLNGFHYFDVREGVNDQFFVRLEGDSSAAVHEWRAVAVPPACYPARFFVSALQKALNDELGDVTTFSVEYHVFDTDALLAARAQFRRDGSKSSIQALPNARIDPYTNLTFAIVIEAKSVFSLAFGQDEQSAAFANLIDYEPREVYELRTLYASRALSLDCADERVQRDWLRLAQRKCAFDCSPCPRRKYEARVDDAHGIVTLQQRIQRPYRVCKADKCADAVRVRVASSSEGDDAPVFFCAGDVLIAARKNPLGADACCAEEVLVTIVGEHAVHEFDLAHDPFPDADEFWLWAMPVGFNLHLHSNGSSSESTFNYFDRDKSSVPQQVAAVNTVTRFLGFRRPTTRSGSFCYTSDQVPASIIDETLLISVPELLALATSESRDTLYTPQSPFDSTMTQYYAQLLLDRATGLYRAFPALVAPLPELSAPRDILPAKGASGVPCLQNMTIGLVRPDGTQYNRHGDPFVLTFELIYVRK